MLERDGRRRSRSRSSSSRRPGRARCSSGSHASGVCHSDQNAIDGTAETRCPAVLGHEGAGVVEAVGAGVPRPSRRPRRALVGAVVRARAPNACATCRSSARRPGRRWATAGLLDGTPRLSRDGEPVYHYSLLSTFAEACVVAGALVRPDSGRRPVRRRRRSSAARSRPASAPSGGRRACGPGDRRRGHRLRRRRAVGAARGGRRRRGAGRRRRRRATRSSARRGARRDRGRALGRRRPRRRRSWSARRRAAASTTRSRRRDGPRR